MDISKHLVGIKLDRQSSEPLYLQIAKVIENKIIDNTLPPATKLPPERELSSLFKVSRTTAINAYRWLEQQGLVITKVGSGTYVSEPPNNSNVTTQVPWSQLFIPYVQTPVSSILKELVSIPLDRDLISLATGMPDPSLYPIDKFKELLNRHIDHLERSSFGYIATEGFTPLRHSVSRMLNNKGIESTWGNTMILSGSQQGLYLMGKAMLAPGDYVVVESPTYTGAIQIFQAMGVKVLILPVSKIFPLDILEDFLIRYRPKIFYTNPTFRNPTGDVLSEGDRRQLINLAARHRLVVVEDDAYGDLYYGDNPPPSLKALDNYGGVVYLGTFSKVLMPGLRLGYINGHPTLIQRLALEKQYNDLHSNNISQWLMHLFLDEGHMEEHLSLIRRQYKNRRNLMIKALKHYFDDNILQYETPDGGFYIWCKIQNSVTSSKLLQESLKKGVFFAPGEAFYTMPSDDKEFRLSFASNSEDTLVEGIRRLSDAFNSASKTKSQRTKTNIRLDYLIN
ncbi:PLP-dependent aminotransferase family protein [Desulfofalx alkaliphila]|uniref:MocR-like pyridoxine biosynthesis transcription factor PdxR n=1 Tax=Desulfofalx alkaliphila TaxID=105483 RepID=UPI0004E1E18E|nr:PLP-dependent aminotransferase family protein [Desulfofalx alkaliphila]